MGEVSNAFVCLMGMGTVFIGLVVIIFGCKIMSFFCRTKEKPVAEAAHAEQPIENRQEIIAAVSAAIAEDLGTDIRAVRILSFKKL